MAELRRAQAATEQAELARSAAERVTLEDAYRAEAYYAPEHNTPHVPTVVKPGAQVPVAPLAAPIQSTDDVAPALYDEMVQALGPVEPTRAESAGVTTSDEELSQEDLPDDDPRLTVPAGA